ncbi:MAG: VRR-NUC domain-containing protein [Clostridium beijerinckii]|nr:VRR-NUC domain-containing protein [Clostridium beijerinckii]
MAAEKIFENEIKKFLSALPNTWFFKYWAGPYSKSGIPDIVACVNGYFVGIEVKAENGHASELQKRNIKLIQRAKGYGYIVYPKDFEKLKKELMELCKS